MTRVLRGFVPAGLLLLAVWGGCKGGSCPKDDGNACTIDGCEGGEPTHDALPDGSTCHEGERTGTCHDGVCLVPCASANDCDDKNPCTAEDCAEPYKVCVYVNVAGPPPDDGNVCTYAMCLSGKPVHVEQVDGTDCRVGDCTSGICSACKLAADCGADSKCVTWDCEAGACVPDFIEIGTVVKKGDVVGDCRRLECDGKGIIVEVTDEEDEPDDDGSACTKEVCIGWTPYHQPLDEGTFCPGGVCRKDDGVCVPCTVDLHCGKLYCHQNQCYSCENGIQDGNETGVDCGGSCAKCIGEPCALDDECGSKHCADGVCCSTSCGTCSTCSEPASLGQCKLVPKYDDDPPACSINSGKMCNGAGVCKTALGSPCGVSFDCASSKCMGGVCVGP